MSALDKKLDDLVREIYHLKYPNPYCFVCKQYKGWFHPKKNPKGCQIGHYIGRSYLATRWYFPNIFPQCAKDNWEHSNKMKGVNPVAFSMAIIDQYGIDYLKQLQIKAKESFKKPQKIKRLAELQQILQELKEAQKK